ncbi:MAG: hypothetical protein Q8N45_01165 [Anaerolineales bacterium]|nr:hypothetical protein [Anaerolineales bacterium]
MVGSFLDGYIPWFIPFMSDAFKPDRGRVSSRGPDGFIEGFQHLLALTIKHFVEPGKTTPFTPEDRVWVTCYLLKSGLPRVRNDGFLPSGCRSI